MSTPGNRQLIIPVTVKAWVITAQTIRDAERYKDFSLDYTDIHSFNGNELEKNDVFYAKPLGPNDRGVHLHWTLPYLFTHGIHHLDQLHFPAVPNRWLVTRFWQGEELLEQKSWMVESDYVGPDATNSWVLTDGDGNFTPTRIGRSYPLGNPPNTESQQAAPLTVLAPGHPLFAANYWSCRNVFGFHDRDIADDEVSGCSYSVIGWYSNDGLNPFHHDSQPAADKAYPGLFEKRKAFFMEHCKTIIPNAGADAAGNFLSTSDVDASQATILCDASLHGIVWDDHRNDDASYRDHPVQYTIANNIKEAISTEIAHRLEAPAAEPLVAALLNDHLKDAANAQEIGAMLHEQHYHPAEGGFVWEIVPDLARQQKERRRVKYFPDENSFRSGEEYRTFIDAFRVINQLQEERDTLSRQRQHVVTALRETVDKLNLVLLEIIRLTPAYDPQKRFTQQELENIARNASEELAGLSNNLRHTIALQVNKLEMISEREQVLENQVGKTEMDEKGTLVLREGTLGRLIRDQLAASLDAEKNVYTLNRKQLPVFWEPAEPVIVFQVPGKTSPGEKYHPDVLNQQEILCRTSDLLLKRLDYSTQEPGLYAELHRPQLFAANKQPLPQDFEGTISRLWLETLALSPACAKKIVSPGRAASASGMVAATLRGFYEGKNEWQITVDAGALPLSEADRTKFTYLLASNLHRVNSAPVCMLWGVNWYPDFEMGGEQPVYRGHDWELSNNSQFRRKGGRGVNYLNTSLLYEGTSILAKVSPGNFVKALGEQALAPDKQYFAQSMGGLYDHLLMKRKAVNIPPKGSPAAILSGISDLVANSTPAHDYAFPVLPGLNQESNNRDPRAFFPVTAAHFQFKNLWLADHFGRLNQLVSNRSTRSVEPLVCLNMQAEPPENAFKVPPALVQPSRLNFAWKSVDKQRVVTSDPATTPVYGWLVFNKLNQSLFVFNHSGNLLGELLFQRTPAAGFLWKTRNDYRTVVKNDAQLAGDLHDHPQVYRFLDHLIGKPDAWPGFTEVLKQVVTSVSGAGSSRDPQLADLIGIPLALASASVRLELYGAAAIKPAWQASPDTGDMRSYTNQVENIRFPVQLGSHHQRKDGLIGYFINQDFDTFYAHYPGKLFTKERLEVQLEEDPYATDLTLLLYPLAGVHAATGVLPVTYIELPEVLLSSGLANLEFNLLVAPVISPESGPVLPLAEEPGTQWLWETAAHAETSVCADSGQKESGFPKQQIVEGYLKLKQIKS